MPDHTKSVLPPQHGRSPGLAERVAWLRRGKRIADALVQVAEQAGETPGLSELLERVCRLTVELMPADRCTIYLWSARRRVYVLAADCGSPPHLAAPEGHHPRRVRFQEELAAEQMMLLCRDHPMSAERFDTLEEAELYSLVVTPLRGRARTIGSMTVGLQRPPCFDEDALGTLRGVARHAATLIENVQLHSRLHKAAALRAKLGEFAVRLGSRNDPVAIGRLACAEGAALFGVSEGVMLLREGDALVPCGSSDDGATALAGLRLSLSERDRPTVQAFHGQRPVVVSDFAATASDDDRERYPELKCMLAIPLVGRAGPMGCLVYADRQRTHRFSAEVAADGVLLGAIVAAALEHVQTLEDAFRANAVLRESEGHFRALVEHGSDVTTIVDAQGESEARARLVVETAPNAVITIDAAGIVTGWNGAAEKLFGWSRDTVVGQPLGTTVIAPQNRAEYERGLARLLAIGEGPGLETLIEITALRRDGHGIPVELVVWPVCARGAHAIGVLVRDITERKRAERLRAGHEQAIELLRARDEALAASRAKVEFLADTTDDIRTLTTLMEPRGGQAEAESQMELDLRRGAESGGVPALLAHVWVSIGGREGAALAHAAHALERSCWAMGAGAIGALRWGIEHLGQASVLAAARETLARAEEELRHVRAVLDARRRPARPRDP